MKTLKEALFSRRNIKRDGYPIDDLLLIKSPYIIVSGNDIIYFIPKENVYYSLLFMDTFRIFKDRTTPKKFNRFIVDMAKEQNSFLVMLYGIISITQITDIAENMRKMVGRNINSIGKILSEILEEYRYEIFDIIK